ncbi:Cobalt-precorrin-5B C(1)-methyltransferase [uncultured Gammaproteobacteria bacterium]
MTGKPLRQGWTTGACAAAAAAAGFEALLGGRFPDPVIIVLPEGRQPAFALASSSCDGGTAEAAIIKDAGDDPDVTHGATIVARVRRLMAGQGLHFKAGAGVGTVTLPGLPLAVGEPAINPGPRAIISDNLHRIATAYGLDAVDVEVEIGVAGGAELALKTLNGRLGIVGGLSILGTNGVVVPYSCSAWVHSIHRAVDVARAIGTEALLAVTGKTSEEGARAFYPDLPEVAVIDVGDFMGALLKYLRRNPVERVIIAGGFAKLSKLAAGHLNLHSGRSEVDFEALAGLVRMVGGTSEQVAAARTANTAMAVLEMAREAGLPLATVVAAKAWYVASQAVYQRLEVEIMVFDRAGRLVGQCEG